MKDEIMTFERLSNLINKYNIPKNVHLLSDSGWECDATEMCGVYYNEKQNVIIFTQEISEYERYDKRNKNYIKGFIALKDSDNNER